MAEPQLCSTEVTPMRAPGIGGDGVRIVKTRAVLESGNTVRLATGDTVRAGHILIATGSAPNHGRSIPGLEHVISSNEVFHLPTQPKRILIQCGGYIALEFACIFAGLGSGVTVVYRCENILRGSDQDVRTHVRSEMERAGIRILTECVVTQVDKHGDAYTSHLSNGSTIASDQVLFAIGRHPNVNGLGLKAAGVKLNPKNGGIAVDGSSRTSVRNIYAVGDVTHRINLTPVAIRVGHAFADSVFGGRPACVDHDDIPTAVFTQPEVGTVGLTEEQALLALGYLHGRLPTFEGDPIGRPVPCDDETCRGLDYRPHSRLPHRRSGSEESRVLRYRCCRRRVSPRGVRCSVS